MAARSIIRQKIQRWLSPDGGPDIRKFLSGLRFVTVAGTTAATNIAVADDDGTGITTDAIVIGVFRVDGTAGSYEEEASVPTAGNLQLDTTNTTGMVLCVVYFEPVTG